MKEIPLIKGFVAFVDDLDYDRIVAEGSWYALPTKQGTARAARGRGDSLVYMHNFITGFSMTDHIDRIPTNNQRINLREANRSKNSFNRAKRSGAIHSAYKGVVLDKNRNKYRAVLTKNGKRFYSKRCKTEEEASMLYNNMALQHFGEFAYVN